MFLLGTLCGTLMTAGLVAIAQALFSIGSTPKVVAVRPTPPVSLPVNLAPPYSFEGPAPVLPPGWHRYRFNGQTVYVMPLDATDGSTTSE